MGRQSNLTVEQRAEAVLSLLRREEPAAKIARRYGISEPTLYRYRDLFLEADKAGLANGSGPADPVTCEQSQDGPVIRVTRTQPGQPAVIRYAGLPRRAWDNVRRIAAESKLEQFEPVVDKKEDVADFGERRLRIDWSCGPRTVPQAHTATWSRPINNSDRIDSLYRILGGLAATHVPATRLSGFPRS